jgi:hypothetical protein
MSITALIVAGFSAITLSAPEQFAFNVLRNGEPMGRHVVSVNPGANGLTEAKIEIDLKVKFGPLTVLDYRHRCTETYTLGNLESAQCETRKDGKITTMRLRREGTQLMISGSSYTGSVPVGAPLSSYWRNDILGASTLINTENGQPIPIRTSAYDRPDGSKCVKVSASVPLDLCYSQTGRWNYTGFKIQGQSISYRPESR